MAAITPANSSGFKAVVFIYIRPLCFKDRNAARYFTHSHQPPRPLPYAEDLLGLLRQLLSPHWKTNIFIDYRHSKNVFGKTTMNVF